MGTTTGQATAGTEVKDANGGGERKGAVLDVLKELLAGGHDDEVVALVSKLVKRNTELEKRLADILSRAKKSEGVSTAQLILALDGLVHEMGCEEANQKLREASGIDELAKKAETTKEPKKPPPVRKPPPPHLPRVDNPIRVPDAERACPLCGHERECIGHDVTETVDLIPAQVIVRRDLREKLACKPCDGEPVRAPLGDKVVAGGAMGTTLVAQLIVDKYWDGLPLHRQRERYLESGYEVAVSTLADQVMWGTDLLRPLWRVAFAVVLDSLIMHLDGTSLAVQDKTVPKGLRLGSLWGYVGVDTGEETALYLYNSTGKKNGQRPGELGPEDVLRLRQGFAVADASNLFEKSFKRDGLIECGCNMHARRYMTKALDGGDVRAALPLAAFKKVYDVEEEVRDRDAAGRLEVRQAKSKPVYDELASWCRVHRPHEPPSSPLGKGINYLLNNEVALRRFLEHGEVPIDNGAVERLHVRAAMTRKNFLFAGSDAGGERAAIAYTLLGCCALAEVNPVEYLADVLPRLARRIRISELPALLPARWKRARAAALPAALMLLANAAPTGDTAPTASARANTTR